MKAMKLSKFLAVFVLAAAFSMPVIRAQAEDLKVGAMPLGSAWYLFGATLAKLIEPNLSAGDTIEVLPRGGGTANPVVVDTGKAQLALSSTAPTVWAYSGDPVYKGEKHQNIRALVGGLNKVWIVAILTEDYIKRTGIDNFSDAVNSGKPLRIVMKPPGSAVPTIADMILDAAGSSRDKIKANGGDIIQVGVQQISQVLRDGRADLYFESALPGHPALTEATLTNDLRFIDIPEDVLTKLIAKGMTPSSMPKLFKGQDGPTRAPVLGTLIIANKALDDDLAYLVTKTIIENADELKKAHKAWSKFDPNQAWKPEHVFIPLHPGAERYYKERGWM